MTEQYRRRAILKAMGLASSALALNHIVGVRAAAFGVASDGWYQGDLLHLLPAASHDRFLIKTSFSSSLASAPLLHINDRKIVGRRSDSRGYFWRFHVAGLTPATRYTLQLKDSANARLCDPWPLSTLPHPDADVGQLRILAYTCAGGDEDLIQADGQAMYIPLAQRQRLLQRGLSMKPDVVIANGDHVYWDEYSMTRDKPEIIMDTWRKLQNELGMLDADKAILGTANEVILKRIVDRQIAHLYGVSLRSVPVYMLTDDHDLFENDEATDDYITLPADPYRLNAARATQHLYYPEFLPDANRPLDLPGSGLIAGSADLSESFGTLRYGRLFEALLYDTKRYVNIDGEKAYMTPPGVEQWLLARTAREDTTHLAHIPSTPIGWSAGKWGEWYTDVLGKNGELVSDIAKPYWPVGWWHQHQRLLQSMSQQKKRLPLIISGDLHMFAGAKIMQSGELDLRHNPVHSFVIGPLGTDGPAYPSAARGVLPQTPTAMQVNEYQKPLEKNGFTIIDINKETIAFEMYAWRAPQALEEIDIMKPLKRIEIKR